MNLSTISALKVNGEVSCLDEILRLARLTNSFTAVQQRVEQLIILQAAREMGISISDEELQQAIDAFRESRGLLQAEATFQWMKSLHIRQDDLEQMVEAVATAAKIRSAIPVDRVEKYFNENRISYDTASISVMQLAEEGEALELLQQIREENADFNSLAREYSLDDSTRLAGGYFGNVHRQALDPEIEALVFGAPAGEVVGPFRNRQGCQLIKIEKQNPACLDEACTDAIRNILYRDWFEQQCRQASVEIPLWELI